MTKKLPESRRAKAVREWLRAGNLNHSHIARETGVKRSWIGVFSSKRSIRNPGVHQIDALYDYMLVDLKLKKKIRKRNLI